MGEESLRGGGHWRVNAKKRVGKQQTAIYIKKTEMRGACNLYYINWMIQTYITQYIVNTMERKRKEEALSTDKKSRGCKRETTLKKRLGKRNNNPMRNVKHKWKLYMCCMASGSVLYYFAAVCIILFPIKSNSYFMSTKRRFSQMISKEISHTKVPS